MAIKIGDLYVATEIISLHYQVIRTQLILDRLIGSNPTLAQAVTQYFIRQIDDQAIERLRKKFPNMGISKNP